MGNEFSSCSSGSCTNPDRCKHMMEAVKVGMLKELKAPLDAYIQTGIRKKDQIKNNFLKQSANTWRWKWPTLSSWLPRETMKLDRTGLACTCPAPDGSWVQSNSPMSPVVCTSHWLPFLNTPPSTLKSISRDLDYVEINPFSAQSACSTRIPPRTFARRASSSWSISTTNLNMPTWWWTLPTLRFRKFQLSILNF